MKTSVWNQADLNLIPRVSFHSCVTLGNRLDLSESQFFHLSNGDNTSTHFVGLFGFTCIEPVHVKHLL